MGDFKLENQCEHGASEKDYCQACHVKQTGKEILESLATFQPGNDVVIQVEGGLVNHVIGTKDYIVVDWDNLDGIDREIEDEILAALDKIEKRLVTHAKV